MDYAAVARYFNGRTVVATLADAERSTYVGTIHPCPQNGRDQVEIRCAFVTVGCDAEAIAHIRPHRRGVAPRPAPAGPVRRTRSGKVRGT